MRFYQRLRAEAVLAPFFLLILWAWVYFFAPPARPRPPRCEPGDAPVTRAAIDAARSR